MSRIAALISGALPRLPPARSRRVSAPSGSRRQSPARGPSLCGALTSVGVTPRIEDRLQGVEAGTSTVRVKPTCLVGPFLASGHGGLSLDASEGCDHSARTAEVTPVDAITPPRFRSRATNLFSGQSRSPPSGPRKLGRLLGRA